MPLPSSRSALALAVAVAITAACGLPLGRQARLAAPGEGWAAAAAPPGSVVRAAAAGAGARRCAPGFDSVAVAPGATRAFVSAACAVSAGDESVRGADPPYAIDELRPDGGVTRHGVVRVGGRRFDGVRPLAVGPDGTLWAAACAPGAGCGSRDSVLARDPTGSWRLVAGAGRGSALADVVDLAVGPDGAVWVAQRRSLLRLDADGRLAAVAGNPRDRDAGRTTYAGEGPALEAGGSLPTLTAVAVRADGVVVVLAVDTVATLVGGRLLTVQSPRRSGADLRTRLVRSVVADNGTGSLLTSVEPYGDDGVLLWDARGARLLALDASGRLELLSSSPATRIGTAPARVAGEQLQGAGPRPLARTALPPHAEMSATTAADGSTQVLLTAHDDGLWRVGLPAP